MIEKERKKEKMLRPWECALVGPGAHLRYFKAKGGKPSTCIHLTDTRDITRLARV